MNAEDTSAPVSERPSWMHRPIKWLFAGIAVMLVLAAIDLWTKEIALDSLSVERSSDVPPVCRPGEDGITRPQRLRTEPEVLVDGYLEFRYAENCGAAFGLMRDANPMLRSILFGCAAVFASVLLFWMFWKGKGRMLFAWSVPLIVSGAIGNLVDRLRHGFVVDFIRFHLQDGWEWPTFNVADAWITIGVAFMLIDGIIEARYESKQRKHAEAPQTS